MAHSGLFVTLYDEDTLKLYLHKGVYGFLMPPIQGEVPTRSRHYHALADYACAREGTHVFFFLKRKIVYGGQIVGAEDCGAFYINGPYSPLGRAVNAALYWDESVRDRYSRHDEPGLFSVPNSDDARCQPYFIRFQDNLQLKGHVIASDELYFEIGKYPYPLPTNTISGMGFCTMTPGEVDTALRLLQKSSVESYDSHSAEPVNLIGQPISFDVTLGFSSIKEALNEDLVISEAHLEAFILANPRLLPVGLQPSTTTTLCRQVPMSPFKPYQVDRANICYYYDPLIQDGTVPNTILELKIEKVGKKEVLQVARYLNWLYVVLPDEASAIKVYLCGPSFAKNCSSHLSEKYRQQVKFVGLA